MSTDQEKFAAGFAKMTELFGDTMKPGETKLPPKFVQATVGHLFGDIWQGDELAIEERSLITCCLLVALGRENEQRIHFRGAKNIGIPRAKIEAAITHIAHYAGWPVAVSAFAILNEAWPEEA